MEGKRRAQMSTRKQLSNTVSMEIRVRGIVQGVGFRPMVWRLAVEFGLSGSVRNDGEGVLIQATGSQPILSEFLTSLRTNAPPLSRIEDIKSSEIELPESDREFRILKSFGGETRTQVTPDAATCSACKADIMDAADRRYEYPFANCTHCGPRFSIVNTVPYDRASTTMAKFTMCRTCLQEYENPADRRFHAQPIACPDCGPKIWLEPLGVKAKQSDNKVLSDTVREVARLLKDGQIIAIRGLGGFHLTCDATNDDTVIRLRKRKRRYGKPFALMARDCATIQRYCDLSDAEKAALQSPAAPIVVLTRHDMKTLPVSVAPGLASLGFMLPYTPLHHLLMQHFADPLIMTSGNISDEPQVIDNAIVSEKLVSIADYALVHDRDIANRIDDSVLRFIAEKPSIIRRARGYAPSAIPLPKGFEAAPDILAYGAELKSTFCLFKDGAAILSQHQGDLENPATLDDFQKNLSLYQALYDHKPTFLACDLHPEYLSTKLAIQTSENDAIPVMSIQHHHAHIASCMAENGVPVSDAPVLGIALDGLGMGDDGTLWGGEFLLVDYVRYKRLASFKPVAMPGGAQAIREPWRNTYAHLQSAIGWPALAEKYNELELFDFLEAKPRAILDKMQAKNINSPSASSCGRLFDAVAAAIGLCRERAFYEGQGAIELESAAGTTRAENGAYPFAITSLGRDELQRIDAAPMWYHLLDDLKQSTPAAVIAARFHNGLAQTIAGMACGLVAAQLDNGNPISRIALSGGCFQNKRLTERILACLAVTGLEIITHNSVPANDGGLSLGQASIAAARQICNTNR